MLGVTWSPIAASAFDLVDCIEVSGWSLADVERSLPLLLHNLDLDFSLAKPGVIDDGWLRRARSTIADTSSPWLSLHLGFSAEEVYFRDHMLPASAPLDRETCRERFIESLQIARDGPPVPLLLENLDYCPEGAYEHVCDPTFIRDVVERLDCGLLLDLAHAQVSADWLGFDVEEYLRNLPMERVVQIHLSSPRRIGGRLDDGHFELTAWDYELFASVLTESAPQAVVLEYTRDAGQLQEQLRRLRAVIQRFC